MAGSGFTQRLDGLLDWLYRNHEKPGHHERPRGQLWAMPPEPQPYPWADGYGENLQPGETFFLHYYQNQRYGSSTDNECVTTSVVMSMNILKDWAAASTGHPADPDRILGEFTGSLDKLGVKAWRYRFSSRSFFPGFMTPWQAVLALRRHAAELRRKYGKSFKVKLSAWHTIEDLVERLRSGKLILLHGAWKRSIDPQKPGYNPLLGWLGGMPHTVLLVGYDSEADSWSLLNPADPWPPDHETPVEPKLQKLTTQELMDFWGRQFLFYPPRFAITTIMVDE
ncbi:MAG: hypothetical protein ACOYYJ_02710 [Chloroflexota bacterium]